MNTFVPDMLVPSMGFQVTVQLTTTLLKDTRKVRTCERLCPVSPSMVKRLAQVLSTLVHKRAVVRAVFMSARRQFLLPLLLNATMGRKRRLGRFAFFSSVDTRTCVRTALAAQSMTSWRCGLLTLFCGWIREGQAFFVFFFFSKIPHTRQSFSHSLMLLL